MMACVLTDCIFQTSFLLELQVNSGRGHERRPAIAVVAGIIDVLQIESSKQTPPDVGVVVRFLDIFSAVVQVSVAQQESLPSKPEVALVIRLDRVRDEDRTGFV